jgi:hypothetical protein
MLYEYAGPVVLVGLAMIVLAGCFFNPFAPSGIDFTRYPKSSCASYCGYDPACTKSCESK